MRILFPGSRLFTGLSCHCSDCSAAHLTVTSSCRSRQVSQSLPGSSEPALSADPSKQWLLSCYCAGWWSPWVVSSSPVFVIRVRNTTPATARWWLYLQAATTWPRTPGCDDSDQGRPSQCGEWRAPHNWIMELFLQNSSIRSDWFKHENCRGGEPRNICNMTKSVVSAGTWRVFVPIVCIKTKWQEIKSITT